MPTGPVERRLAVRFDERVWREAVRGFSGKTLQIATTAKVKVEDEGVALTQLLPCDLLGPDQTELAGCAKLYLPVVEGPPSQRPFAFVFQLAREVEGRLALVFVAFGTRHAGIGVRIVYERAHRQLHGHFPT